MEKDSYIKKLAETYLEEVKDETVSIYDRYVGFVDGVTKHLNSMWHDGSEKPDTGRIMYESTDGCCCCADYDKECNRFDSDDECYYSGMWEHCHIKRWIYELDILNL